MARLNIDDQFWDDIAAVKLDRFTAIGQALVLFKVAQNRFKDGKIVSDEDWRIHEFSDALIPVFAEKVPGGYEVRGVSKYFGWLKERQEAGRRGGQAKASRDATRSNNSNEIALAKPSKSYPLNLNLPQKEINTFKKNLNFEEATERVLEGIRRFGPDHSTQLKAFLGDELWGLVQGAGGAGRIRQMKADQWLSINVSKLLKSATTNQRNNQ